MTTTIESLKDRTRAGQILAGELAEYTGRPDVAVVALSPCGLPVAAEVARALRCPLDMILSRRLRLPGEGLSAGAVSCEGVRVLDDDVIEREGLDQHCIEELAAKELTELHRQEMIFRGKTGPPHLPGKIILLVADCAVSGASLLAAVRILRVEEPAKIIAAVPVLSPEAADVLRPEVDGLVSLVIRERFRNPRECYNDDCEAGEDSVRRMLAGRICLPATAVTACAVPG